MTLLLLMACSEYDYADIARNETFVQPALDGATDVLFVVDNSPSMEEEQERLQSSFEVFAEVLSTSLADFRVGIVSTDVGEEGALRGQFDRDTPELSAAFAQAAAVGVSGDREEQGLECAWLATENTDFTRKGARLNVVVLSDEDDHSPASVAVYMQQFQRHAGDAGFVLHAIVGDEPLGCVSQGSAADAGVRYIESAETTGGYRDSICQVDYGEILERIGLQVAGLGDSFYLGELPQPDTLEVRVDSVLIPGREQDGWTYEPDENAVRFHGRAVPRAGMTVQIRYQPLLGVPADSGE
ncbi:MAG: hypothetical protein ACI9VR_003101 [Cognaticolwellia sp.]|jgi:hypothetical protein